MLKNFSRKIAYVLLADMLVKCPLEQIADIVLYGHQIYYVIGYA